MGGLIYYALQRLAGFLSMATRRKERVPFYYLEPAELCGCSDDTACVECCGCEYCANGWDCDWFGDTRDD